MSARFGQRYLSEEQFVDQVTENGPETPPNHETITSANTTSRWPAAGDLADLEAGANRCAAS